MGSHDGRFPVIRQSSAVGAFVRRSADLVDQPRRPILTDTIRRMVIAAATEGPNWTDIMTAFGTVGAVVTAVGIALWTEWQSSRRIRAERRHATATLKEERRLAQEREQFAQAYAIQVVEGHRTDADEKARQTLGLNAPATTRSAVFLVDHGSFTITDIRAWLRNEDGSLEDSAGAVRRTGFTNLPEEVRRHWSSSLELATPKLLRPWDDGIVFVSKPFATGPLGPAADWSGFLPELRPLFPSYWIVQWTDQWGTRWEHQRGLAAAGPRRRTGAALTAGSPAAACHRGAGLGRRRSVVDGHVPRHCGQHAPDPVRLTDRR